MWIHYTPSARLASNPATRWRPSTINLDTVARMVEDELKGFGNLLPVIKLTFRWGGELSLPFDSKEIRDRVLLRLREEINPLDLETLGTL